MDYTAVYDGILMDRTVGYYYYYYFRFANGVQRDNTTTPGVGEV